MKHWFTAFLEDLFTTLVLFHCPICKGLAKHKEDCDFGWSIEIFEIPKFEPPLTIWTEEGTITFEGPYVDGVSEIRSELVRRD